MKKLLLFLVLAMAMGTAVAWAINYKRFAGRDARFGPFTIDGAVSPDNVLDHITKNLPKEMPRVEVVGDSTHDFGIMAPGSEGEHTFVVKNVGQEDLRLRLGASTCKCTLGELDREALAPGEQTEVKLSWTVKPGENEFNQSAEVLTNDPRRVAIKFAITGKVILDAEVVPETWTFGEVATGEPFEVSGTIFNFMDFDITPTEVKFSSEEMTELSEFEVEPFQPSEADGIRSTARQGFRVNVKTKAGMRQGAVSQNFMFGFRKADEDGDSSTSEEGQQDTTSYILAPTKGRIVGPLGMILSSKLRGRTGGGYVYDFGRIGKDGSLTGKAFVVLKGNERDNTTLRIGEVYPENIVKAKLGEPKGRGSMVLYPLEIELVPGKETIERLGKSKDDYGSIWIESDNPKVTKMRIALKFAIEGR